MSQSLRILHVITRGARGGTERNLRNMTEIEAELGHQVFVVTGDQTVQFASARVRRLPSLKREISPFHDLRAAIWLRRFIKTEHFDVVHTHESKAGVLGRLASMGAPNLRIHSIHMVSFGAGYSRGQSYFFRTCERLCGLVTGLYVSVGKELITRYVDGGVAPVERFVLVRSPVNIEAFVRPTRLPSVPAILEQIPAEVKLVMTAGLLEKRKRVDLIIRELAPHLCKDLRLVIAGEGPETDELASLAGRMGVKEWVIFTGYVDNLAEFFWRCSVVCHASLAEGVPQVLIQAVAADLPVVATDVEGLREISEEIQVVSRDGRGFALEVLRSLDRKSHRRDGALTDLSEWSSETVSRQISDFEALQARLVGEMSRRGNGRRPGSCVG